MKQLLFISICLSAAACKKTPLIDVSDSFFGTWKHYSSKVDAHTIVILPDGTGYMTSTQDGKESGQTKTRDLFLEDNELSFGKVSFNGETYDVDKYPTFTWDEIINFWDTIPANKKYMILDGNYYAEQ